METWNETTLVRLGLAPRLHVRPGRSVSSGGRLRHRSSQGSGAATWSPPTPRDVYFSALVALLSGALVGWSLGREPLREERDTWKMSAESSWSLLVDRSCFLAVDVEPVLAGRIRGGYSALYQLGWPYQEIRAVLEEEDCAEDPVDWSAVEKMMAEKEMRQMEMADD